MKLALYIIGAVIVIALIGVCWCFGVIWRMLRGDREP
jgi:hypothetical protein